MHGEGGLAAHNGSWAFLKLDTNTTAISDNCTKEGIVCKRRPTRNRKLDISTAPTKVKSREPAYSQTLIQNKIDRQRVECRTSPDYSPGFDEQSIYCHEE